jgi:ribonuclease P protein component
LFPGLPVQKMYLYLLKQFTLSAKERLKSRKQIGLVFNKGRQLSLPPIRVSWVLEEGNREELLQVGVGASSRHFKRAVDRNRIKRLLRESWRVRKMPLKESLARANKTLSVFIIFTGKQLPTLEELSPKMQQAIDTLTQLVHESHTATT